MKYLSLIIIVALMQITWNLTRSDAEISQDVHIGIQQDLQRLIQGYIEENLPNSTGLEFTKFWTEKLNTNQVKALFAYTFEDENATVGRAQVEIEGYAILNRDVTSDEDYEVWTFDELFILNNEIEFKEPLSIRHGSPEEALEE